MYVIAKELVGLPGMPETEKGIRGALQRFSKGLDDCFRRREGTKAIEYHINCLPKAAQEIVLERHFKKLMEETVSPGEVKAPKKRRVDTDSVEVTEAYRGSPGVMRERLDALTENQRRVSGARCGVVQEVLRLGSEPGFSCAKAIHLIVEQSKKGTLNARLTELVRVANARKGKSRALSEITLKRWLAGYNKAQNAAECLLLLAPGKRSAVIVTEISWMSDFMAHYRQSNGRPITEAYEGFVAEWQRRHADEPHMLEVVPSYDTVLRAMRKIPEVEKQKGRITGSEYRQLEGFTRRDWSKMPVNYVWIGDGHGMKMKCAHPIHGRPFSPEVTFVIDGGTRFVVGWSLDLAENVFAVA
ncbi:transposase, partial [Salmonella enterica]|nr:transposase [Salmonella enterica]